MKVTNILNCWLDQTIFFLCPILFPTHSLSALLSAVLRFSIFVNSIIKTSNDLTNLLERILTLNRSGARSGYLRVGERACVCDENSHAIYAIVCECFWPFFYFLAQFGLHYHKILSCKLCVQWWCSLWVRCALCAVYSTFHGMITANKALN